MKLRRRCMQTLRVSVKQLRKKLYELGARILHAQTSKPRDMALVILSMGSAMDVPKGGGSGKKGSDDPKKNPPKNLPKHFSKEKEQQPETSSGRPRTIQEAMLAEARDRALRSESVKKDLALNLPPRIELPDGEERAYGSGRNMKLRTRYQENELLQKCVKAPPNQTVYDTGEEQKPVPYLRHSNCWIEAGEQSRPSNGNNVTNAANTILKMFRKFPSPGGASSSKKAALSSYTESSSAGSTLSNITMLPCDTDETQRQQRQQQKLQQQLMEQRDYWRLSQQHQQEQQHKQQQRRQQQQQRQQQQHERQVIAYNKERSSRRTEEDDQNEEKISDEEQEKCV